MDSAGTEQVHTPATTALRSLLTEITDVQFTTISEQYITAARGFLLVFRYAHSLDFMTLWLGPEDTHTCPRLLPRPRVPVDRSLAQEASLQEVKKLRDQIYRVKGGEQAVRCTRHAIITHVVLTSVGLFAARSDRSRRHKVGSDRRARGPTVHHRQAVCRVAPAVLRDKREAESQRGRDVRRAVPPDVSEVPSPAAHSLQTFISTMYRPVDPIYDLLWLIDCIIHDFFLIPISSRFCSCSHALASDTPFACTM